MSPALAAISTTGGATVLWVYVLLIAAASTIGGTSVILLSLGHRRMQVLLSLTGGVMLGVALLHLLPHAVHHSGGRIDWVARWMLGGFFLMFLLERAFHGHAHHAHDPDGPTICVQGHRHDDHGHAVERGLHQEHAAAGGRTVAPLAWVGAFAGLAVHSLADGAALAASVRIDGEGAGWLAGLATFVAIILHKPFDSLMIATLMLAAAVPVRIRRGVTIAYAMFVPLGAIVFEEVVGRLGPRSETFLSAWMAIAAGAFLCIAAADLLPEVEFHSHDRVLLSAALLLGMGLAWGMTLLEHATHAHAAHQSHSSDGSGGLDHATERSR
ncbi:MAG: ZIP family metal transporter [Planctomycetaceae bacterium]